MSDFTFNEILERRGADLKTSRIVRHNPDALKAWRYSRACFENYFSYQKIGNNTPYNEASTIFQFVPVGKTYALFVGAYSVLDEWHFPDDRRQHIFHDPKFGEYDEKPHLRYDLERIPEFEDLVGKIVIDWGGGTRAWSQWPAKQDKPIMEVRMEQQDNPFPGFSKFSSSIEGIEFLPNSWQGALSSVRGVYLLVCPSTGEQYVGSASGEGGFMGRWLAYAADGHGGNLLLRTREKSNYAVSILEVASPDMSTSDIIHRENAWKNKLGSRAHGLNAN